MQSRGDCLRPNLSEFKQTLKGVITNTFRGFVVRGALLGSSRLKRSTALGNAQSGRVVGGEFDLC